MKGIFLYLYQGGGDELNFEVRIRVQLSGKSNFVNSILRCNWVLLNMMHLKLGPVG